MCTISIKQSIASTIINKPRLRNIIRGTLKKHSLYKALCFDEISLYLFIKYIDLLENKLKFNELTYIELYENSLILQEILSKNDNMFLYESFYNICKDLGIHKNKLDKKISDNDKVVLLIFVEEVNTIKKDVIKKMGI